jgi:O-6-methylguanine DNA methyltransferase
MYEKKECLENFRRKGDFKMIKVCYKKKKNIWFGFAVRDSQVIATDYSFKEPDFQRLIQKLPKNASYKIIEETDDYHEKILNILEHIFYGNDPESYPFEINLTNLSSYAQKVLNCTRLIPVGYVTSYGAIAKVVGGIPRSVGRIEACNTIPLLIPCHRVVSSDLSIGGYGHGTKTKKDVLQREERGYKEPIIIKLNERELILYPTEFVH